DWTVPVSALYLLARPSTPAEVREEVIERAEAGDRITVAAVKKVVEQAASSASPVENDPPGSNNLSDTPRKKLAPPKAQPAGSKPTLTTKSEKAGRAVVPGDEALHGFTACVCD